MRERQVAECVKVLQGSGIRVSLFIHPDPRQIEAAIRTGAEMVELHTGCFANAAADARDPETNLLAEGARLAKTGGLQVNAGHGLNYHNLTDLFAVPHLTELNIGHSIVARATRVGMAAAVREMKELMATYSEEVRLSG